MPNAHAHCACSSSSSKLCFSTCQLTRAHALSMAEWAAIACWAYCQKPSYSPGHMCKCSMHRPAAIRFAAQTSALRSMAFWWSPGVMGHTSRRCRGSGYRIAEQRSACRGTARQWTSPIARRFAAAMKPSLLQLLSHSWQARQGPAPVLDAVLVRGWPASMANEGVMHHACPALCNTCGRIGASAE